MTMRKPPKVRSLSCREVPFAAAYVCSAMIIGMILAMLPGASGATAQSSQRFDLDEWNRIDKRDLPESTQEWLEEIEVILTKEEEETFLRLETELQRAEFMKRFWVVRDPTPGTPQNEYYDEYQRRLEYVQRTLGRDTPREGRETDRGRMYLLLGEPGTIKRLHNTRDAVPVEIWSYRANPKLGIPPFFNLAFFQRSGAGEFQLYSPLMDGAYEILNPDGQRQAEQYARSGRSINEGLIGAIYDILLGTDPELAMVALSSLPNDVGALIGMSNAGLRTEILISDIETIPYRIMPNAQWAYAILTGRVDADVRFESLPIRAQAFALIDPTGDAFLHYGLMTDGRRLNLNNYEGKWYVTFEVAGSVVDEQNRIITGVMGAADPSSKFLQADLEEEEARMLRSGPIVYLDRIPLVEGTFDFDLVVENNVSREYGRSEIRVSVPPPWPSALQSSPALLLWNVYTDDEYRVYNEHYPFQVGPYTMIPALDNSFFTDEGIYIFRQIYLPENYEEQIVLTYQLENDAGIVIQRTEYTDISKADGRGTLDHGTRINIADVAPGEYKLFVDVENDARGREAFDITLRDPSAEILQPFIHIAPGPPPTDPGFALDRAHQLRTLGKIDEAIPLLEEALTRVNDKELVELQIDLLMDAGKFDEVRDFLGPLLVDDPSNVTMLRVIALANANLGNHWDSIRYYERVRIVEEKESTDILNPLASAYYADGRIDKAREILQLSLKVNPEQPQIQKLLEELLRKRHSDT